MVKGVPYWIPMIGEKRYFVKAIVIYPNKNVKMTNVYDNNTTFDIVDGKIKRTYIVDPKAIYFFNGDPVLFYHSTKSSPLSLNLSDADYEFTTSMDSLEFQSVIESKAVGDLLEASKGSKWDLHFIASLVSAIGVVILILTSGALQSLLPGA